MQKRHRRLFRPVYGRLRIKNSKDRGYETGVEFISFGVIMTNQKGHLDIHHTNLLYQVPGTVLITRTPTIARNHSVKSCSLIHKTVYKV